MRLFYLQESLLALAEFHALSIAFCTMNESTLHPLMRPEKLMWFQVTEGIEVSLIMIKKC